MPRQPINAAIALAIASLAFPGLVACSDTVESTDTTRRMPGRDGVPFLSSTTTSNASPTTTIAIGPTAPPSDQQEVYDAIMQFLDATLPNSPGLAEVVTDRESLAQCMLTAGYQVNSLPPPDLENPPSTIAPPIVMIRPMLAYLTQVCTGLQIQEWAGK